MEKTGYTQLTQEERYQIYAFCKVDYSPAQIARQLGRPRSTITRELQRNSGQRGYRPQQAHQKALQRRQERVARPRQNTIAAATWQRVEEKLQEQWSPEQISGWLKKHSAVSLSHERIYQYIYADKKASGTLHQHLRCQKKRRKRYASGQQRRGQIPNQRRISERPALVQERSRIGDWEADTIIGKGHSGAIVSLTERTSRLTLLQKVDARTAPAVQQAVIDLLTAVQQQTNPTKLTNKVHTITADNGKEFASHQAIAAALEAEFFFAHPYASWERGSNENANGLVRQYFPKSCDFATLTEADVNHVMQRLNNRPRKTLDFHTPNQVFHGLQPVALTT